MNQVRIIGGEWKRRLIRFEAIDGLRPTPDRVRETLFNWLMWDTAGKHVLDVCAGSGVLGFEALSRGATHCVFIEPNTKQATHIKQNAALLNTDNFKLFVKNAELVLPTLKIKFDLVFLDPPYALDLWQSLASLIDPLLSPKAKIYVEADRPFEQLNLPTHWKLVKQTKAGQVWAGLFDNAI
jgi:16S rRNA (guanine966-N2)-methyltransferase